ncbi:MAG: hypothetical protein HOP22_04310 [Nitrospiraceae bacterium]|nr:hypothetical protein [Nitrospiraceae bacterium]
MGWSLIATNPVNVGAGERRRTPPVARGTLAASQALLSLVGKERITIDLPIATQA